MNVVTKRNDKCHNYSFKCNRLIAAIEFPKGILIFSKKEIIQEAPFWVLNIEKCTN
jgi:hypothetical protein